MSTLQIKDIKGVGTVTIGKLNAMGIHTGADLLRHLPRRYEDRSNIVQIQSVAPEQYYCIFGTLTNLSMRRYAGGGYVEGEVSDPTGRIKCIWFHSAYLMKSLVVGESLGIFGQAVFRGKSLCFVHPEMEKHSANETKKIHMGRIVPFYPLAGSISQRVIRTAVYEALIAFLPKIEDSLPVFLREGEDLCNIKFALKEIHFPTTMENANAAHQRMIFDEFISIRLALRLKRSQQRLRTNASGVISESFDQYLRKFQSLLPFNLSAGQMAAMKDIHEDMEGGHLLRLIQGDVGSGKTVVAAFAVFLCCEADLQAVLIVPTDILATQHHLTLSKYFTPLGVEVGLLTGGLGQLEQSHVLEGVRSGLIRVLIGTHSILSDRVVFKGLGLSVFDEQHKFGVDQRTVLQKKHTHPFHLSLSATPIPRTLAMALYGEMDISEIKAGDRKMSVKKTLWLSSSEREAAYRLAGAEIAAGRQVYLVFPAVRKSEHKSSLSIEDSHEFLRRYLPDVSFGVIHGKMKKSQVESVMEKFRNNDISVLIATTVIEVGLDIKNASVMIIEGADCFGLSQLHQLRGRIGRGSSKSFCVMVADTDNP
ncbi:MAG: ATP-dependent DNA helicase RecG, partial [Candidatus Omnitrophica bacterium]|nr:ATP-dependent DNA helicase RecG [Candidatus Omnitrophota bacterium]